MKQQIRFTQQYSKTQKSAIPPCASAPIDLAVPGSIRCCRRMLVSRCRPACRRQPSAAASRRRQRRRAVRARPHPGDAACRPEPDRIRQGARAARRPWQEDRPERAARRRAAGQCIGKGRHRAAARNIRISNSPNWTACVKPNFVPQRPLLRQRMALEQGRRRRRLGHDARARGVIIAILDSGVDGSHPDLARADGARL